MPRWHAQAVKFMLVTRLSLEKRDRTVHHPADKCATAGHSRSLSIERQNVCLATPMFLNGSKTAAKICVSRKCFLPNWRASIQRNCIATNQERPNCGRKRQRRSPQRSASAPPGSCTGRYLLQEGHKSTLPCRP